MKSGYDPNFIKITDKMNKADKMEAMKNNIIRILKYEMRLKEQYNDALSINKELKDPKFAKKHYLKF